MIISVASGKGGTGKTLVATSLVFSLKDGYRVQLLDCDVEEPNDHIFLKPDITGRESVGIPVPKVDKEKCTYCGKCAEVCAYHAIAVISKNVLVFPHLCHGCGACGYLCPEKAIVEEKKEIGIVETGHAAGVAFVQGRLNVGEAMPTPLIRAVKGLADHAGICIIDVPPGTSCPVVTAVKDSDFCLLVTEPTPFGLNDLMLAVQTVKQLGVPCGVVINRAYADNNDTAEYCLRENLPVLMTIPLDTEIARLYSRGITLAEGMPPWREKFKRLYLEIRELVDERSNCLKR
ncbi:MAG: ATP-binding protein [Dehalococcoidales bacterium]|jgi:MinD superfamily P-loop ATPase